MKLLIAGGGTGGHVFTGIALAQELQSRGTENQIVFVGTEKGLESRLVPQAGFRLLTIDIFGFKGLSWAKKIRCLVFLPRSFFQSLMIILREKPDRMIGVGGYASFPLIVIGSLLGITTAIIEQNSVPGLANKVLGRFAKRVFLAFSITRKYFRSNRCLLTGNPVRREVLSHAQTTTFKKMSDTKTQKTLHILIFGGSLGALAIDQALMAAGPLLKDIAEKIEVRHQTNGKLLSDLQTTYQEAGIKAQVEKFFDDMGSLYVWADLIFCRAGAISVSEIATLGKPAVFIPFPFATDNHQEANARSLTDHGAGMLLLDVDLNGKKVSQIIRQNIEDRGHFVDMGDQALRFSSQRAAQTLVDALSF